MRASVAKYLCYRTVQCIITLEMQQASVVLVL
jgi:hypothetical protein